jgi:DNA-binding PadR family transcriptional regulator
MFLKKGNEKLHHHGMPQEHTRGERPHHRGGPNGHGGGRGNHGDGEGGPRGRARRGEARYVLLDALHNGPKHGYEIIKTLEEKSGGRYVPSPGTVYPTMQYLEDLGLVRADQDSERRVYHLTEQGLAELETRTDDLAAFWGRFVESASTGAGDTESGFLQDELEALARTAWSGLNGAIARGDQDTIRRVRQAVEECRSRIREMLTETSKDKTKENPE